MRLFQDLKFDSNGHTREVVEKMDLFGHNKLEEKKKNKFLKFWSFMVNPFLWVMKATTFLVIALENARGKSLDWKDFVGIFTLLIKIKINFIEEYNVDKVVATVMTSLAPKAKFLRDQKWIKEVASILISNGIIAVKQGDADVFSS